VEIASLQAVLEQSVGSYRLLLGTNVAALKYMKREIEQKKEEKMISYDFTVFNSSGSNAGTNITKMEDNSSSGKKIRDKDTKKKRKAVINVGNGNALKQSKK
jgi:hypothetical protein